MKKALILILVGLFAGGTGVLASSPDDISGMIPAGSSSLLIGPGGQILFSKNIDLLLVPASTLKILTALSVLESLPPGFRFKTEFYLTRKGELIIKGYGDPLFTSEVMDKRAFMLSRKIHSVAKIIVDDSFFEYPVEVPGVSDSLNPYDAPNGALSANFNTIFFTREKDGRIKSAEQQTPLIPFAERLIESLSIPEGRVVLPGTDRTPAIYAGHLFKRFLEKHNVITGKEVVPGMVNEKEDRLLLRSFSPYSLYEVVGRLFKYSNNFMANQILITAGALRFGPPGNIEKGIRFLTGYMREKIAGKGFIIAEGSGISRKNRISARTMSAVLKAFSPFFRLLTYHKGIWYKTGTLNRVSTMAGYIETRDKRLCPFVVMINGKKAKAGPVAARLKEYVDSVQP